MQVGELHAKVTVDISGVQKSLDTVQRSVRQSNKSIETSFVSLTKTIRFGVAAVATAVSAKLLGGLTNTVVGMEQLNRALKFATGDAIAARQAFAFLQEQSIKLGLPLEVLVKSFIGLSAVTKGTILEGRETEKIFLGLAQASAALGLSSEQIAGSFVAIQQTLAKGTIQAEEWRGQLAERIPIATRVLTKALGITTAELEKFMQQGLLRSTEIIPIFVNALTQEVQPALDDLTGSATQSFGRLQAAWFDLKKTFVESPIGDAIVWTLERITDALKFLSKAIDATFAKFGQLTGVIKRFFGIIDEEREAQAKTIEQTARQYDVITVTPLRRPVQEEAAIVEEERRGRELGSQLESSIQKVAGPTFELNELMNTLGDSIDVVTESLIEFIRTGSIDFRYMAESILSDITRLIIRLYVLKPLIEAIASALGFSSKGIATSLLTRGSLAFANGGIINEPIAGIGLASGRSYTFGERGPETITPGVGMQSTNVIINAVDAASFSDMVSRNPNSILKIVTESFKSGNQGMVSAMRGSI